jgi:RNA polymerase sigma-70 factor, ECF subfamily
VEASLARSPFQQNLFPVHTTSISKSSVSQSTGQDELDYIVAQARSGDRQAFNRLVLHYQDIIVNLCVNLTGNRCDGEDVAQDTFIKAFEQINSFRGDAQFSTWIHTIAVNLCRNKQRSFWQKLFRRSVSIGLPLFDDDDTSDTVDVVDSSMHPNQQLEHKELQTQIKRSLLKLPVRFRELIVLREIRQLSYSEIAVILGVPEGTVKSGIARARLALQAEFKGVVDGFQ